MKWPWSKPECELVLAWTTKDGWFRRRFVVDKEFFGDLKDAPNKLELRSLEIAWRDGQTAKWERMNEKGAKKA